MDIYQIMVKHNRPWSVREIITFMIVFIIVAIILSILVLIKKIKISQAITSLLFLTFLAIVFASTVFTRQLGVRMYQLEVFWSWKEIFKIGECGRLGSTGTEGGLLQENLLNMILLMPAGILLPFIFNKKIRWWQGLLVGVLISSGIESLQLILCRGLFEFDDIIHNSFGCMVGAVLVSRWKKNGR